MRFVRLDLLIVLAGKWVHVAGAIGLKHAFAKLFFIQVT